MLNRVDILDFKTRNTKMVDKVRAVLLSFKNANALYIATKVCGLLRVCELHSNLIFLKKVTALLGQYPNGETRVRFVN